MILNEATSVVLDPRGTISKALGELAAEGGPELDISALSSQVKVSPDRLDRFERGQIGALDLTAVEQLCCVLGRSPNDLLGYEADL